MPDGYERLNNPTARQAKFLGIGSPGLRSPRRAPPPSRTSPQSAQTGSSPGSPAARQPGSPGQPRSALRRNVTRKQMLDGGEIARLRGAVRGEGSLRIQFGLKMLHDPRLRTILERESFYMNVIDSRILTVHILVRGVLSYFSPVRVAVLLALAGVYVSVALTCAVAGPDTSNGSRTICAADFSSSSASSDLYRPALLNSVAGLLLSFYASAVVGEYKNAYLACQRMKGAVMQLMTIAGAEMGDQGASGLEALIDLWRAVNLVHLATYCLADKRRDIYSFDNFLLPVAEAFGPHDGAQQIGMFRRSELRGLGKEHLISSGAPQAGAASCESGSVGDGCDPRDEDEYDLSATHLQAATHAERADDLMGDVRGNVRSDAALVYQFCACAALAPSHTSQEGKTPPPLATPPLLRERAINTAAARPSATAHRRRVLPGSKPSPASCPLPLPIAHSTPTKVGPRLSLHTATLAGRRPALWVAIAGAPRRLGAHVSGGAGLHQGEADVDGRARVGRRSGRCAHSFGGGAASSALPYAQGVPDVCPGRPLHDPARRRVHRRRGRRPAVARADWGTAVVAGRAVARDAERCGP